MPAKVPRRENSSSPEEPTKKPIITTPRQPIVFVDVEDPNNMLEKKTLKQIVNDRATL